MAMTANKCKGIRAAVCHDNFSAERAKLSNNGNVLCMGERVIGPELAKKITKEWLSLEFKDGSSTPKVAAKNPSAETIIDVTDDVSAIRIASFFSFPLHRSFLYRVVIKIA